MRNGNNKIKINDVSNEAKHSLVSRLIVSAVLLIIVLPCIILGDYVFMGLVLVCSLLSAYEICKAPQSIEKKFNNIIFVFAFFMMILMVFWTFSRRLIDSYLLHEYTPANKNLPFIYNIYTGFSSPTISLSAFVICMVFFFLMVLIDKSFTIHDAFYFIGMLFIVSLGYQTLMYLRLYPSYAISTAISYNESLFNQGEVMKITQEELDSLKALLNDPWYKYGESALLFIYMCLGTLVTDAGAYLTGMLFGKHKLCPRISPKKTVEGFVGGIIFSIVITLTFAFSLVFTGHPMVYGLLDREHWYFILVISLLMPFVSSFGDLLFSCVKRGYQVKDFGRILKSHGGILDRVDSVLVTSILLGLIIPLFNEILRIIEITK